MARAMPLFRRWENADAFRPRYNHRPLLRWLRITSTSCSERPDHLLPGSERQRTKRIVQDGAGYILPDGTRVAADERGGFRLPNSEYVTVLADGLLLPNGVQCKADGAGGFLCP